MASGITQQRVAQSSIRPFEPERDREAAQRIWLETGWIEDNKSAREAMDIFVAGSRATVGEVHGEAECLVLTMPGTVRHGRIDLAFGLVAAVTTSRIARKQGLAARMTAQAIAADVADGALVSGLGMFEQGFYNRLGFGTGGYVHRFGFDPASLTVPNATRPPRRLSVADAEQVHANRLARRRVHGSCNITPVESTRGDLHENQVTRFGLGYFDGPGGALSHHIWIDPRGKVEFGPYYTWWMAWSTTEQFLELMGLLKNLGDQVRLVYVRESHGLQLQDLVRKPFQHRQITTSSDFDARMRVAAYWQMRINDIRTCLEKTELPGRETVRFNLECTDPIEDHLPGDAPWRGVAGAYVVTLGPRCAAEPGRDGSLPTLKTTVNALTRLWLGVRPATALAITDDLEAPESLLEQLDGTLCLPDPQPDWDF